MLLTFVGTFGFNILSFSTNFRETNAVKKSATLILQP